MCVLVYVSGVREEINQIGRTMFFNFNLPRGLPRLDFWRLKKNTSTTSKKAVKGSFFFFTFSSFFCTAADGSFACTRLLCVS